MMKRDGFFVRREWFNAIMAWWTHGNDIEPDAGKRAKLAMRLLTRVALHALDGDVEINDKVDLAELLYDSIVSMVDEDVAELRKLGFIE